MAAVKMEVFSDFQCPACKNLHDQTLHLVRSQYADKGKVLMIHRDFPLPIHSFARPAALYSVAASRLGKWDVVADALFKNQDSWSKTGSIEALISPLFTPAEAKKLKALTASPEILAELEADIRRGTEVRLKQTPTMVFTHKGKQHSAPGLVTFPIVSKFIDQLLAS